MCICYRNAALIVGLVYMSLDLHTGVHLSFHFLGEPGQCQVVTYVIQEFLRGTDQVNRKACVGKYVGM